MSVTVNPEVLMRIKDWRPWVEAKLGFRNYWYPIAFSREIDEGGHRAVQLLGEKILLIRSGGTLYGVRDRCLHRGVPFSKNVECHVPGTLTCWYHGWTYDLQNGQICDVLTDPKSKMVNQPGIKTYPVSEAKGLVFVYIGDAEPGPLKNDVPVGFLDDDLAVEGISRVVNANWRLGVENGIDPTHIYIHRDAPGVILEHAVIPLSLSPKRPLNGRPDVDSGPVGVWHDELFSPDAVEASFEGKIKGHLVRTNPITSESKPIGTEGSLWMPGVLRIGPFPDHTVFQYEWYVPIDEKSHLYIQTQTRRVKSDQEKQRFSDEFWMYKKDTWLHGFNDADIIAREATQQFYEDDWGWINERLFEPDSVLIDWRKFASQHHRGIQLPHHLL